MADEDKAKVIDALFEGDSGSDSDSDDEPAKKSGANAKEDKSTAYDDEKVEKATKADDAFIDDDDDPNAGMTEEYNKQEQNFAEDERDDEFEAGRPPPPSSGGGKNEKMDRQTALNIIAVGVGVVIWTIVSVCVRKSSGEQQYWYPQVSHSHESSCSGSALVFVFVLAFMLWSACGVFDAQSSKPG